MVEATQGDLLGSIQIEAAMARSNLVDWSPLQPVL
jgi:hypothetical protein